MTDRILLCVDVSYQAYRAAAAHPRLSSGDTFTGGLYGFLMTLGKTVRETRATDVAFCLDVKPYLRSRDYPEYKALRAQTQDPELRERMHTSKELVIDCLDAIGFKTWGIPGFESDDLIGHVVHRYRHRFDKIYASSNDSDLYQLMALCPEFYLYKDGIDTCISARKLAHAPAEYMLATALSGTHNDIAGIAGIGPAKSMAAVKDPVLMRTFREKHGALIDRNLDLIRLPHREFPRGARIPQHRGSFVARDLYRFLGRYEIETTQSMVNAFDQLQEGQR